MKFWTIPKPERFAGALPLEPAAADALSSSGPLTEAQVRFFHAEGYLSLPPIMSAAEVAALRIVYEQLFARRAGWSEGNYLDFAGLDDSRPRLPQILMPSQYEPALRTSLLHARCLAMARQLLGPAAEFHFDHAMTKPAGGGPPTPWHQDKAFYTRKTTHRTVTFWVALQPVTADGGCLRFIPRSHLGPLLEHRHLGGDRRIHGLEAIGVDESSEVYCPLEAGGATIHHHMTLHGAGANVAGGERWAYAMGIGLRSTTPIVPREYRWNRGIHTAREERFHESLGGRQRVSHKLRTMLAQWGLI